MKICIALGKHPVYKFLRKLFKRIGRTEDMLGRFQLPLKTTHLEIIKDVSEDCSIIIIKSPLISINAWWMLLKGRPVLFVEEYFKKGKITNLIVTLLLRTFFRKYPFIAMTKRTHRFLKSLGLKTILIPPATKERKGAPPSKRKHILFVGRMVETKNPEFFLELAKAMPEEKFVMIGKGPLLEKIKKRKREENIRNLQIIPYIKSRKTLLKEYFAKAKLLIHPAKKDPIGFVIIEALSTQTPILASSSTGASDFLPRDWVLKSFDKKKWIKKMKEIIENQAKAQKKAKEIFNKEGLNERYVMEKYVKRLKKVIQCSNFGRVKI